MKQAFSLIELIFAIVIIGILAAVALPKFVGIGEQAHVSNLKNWVATLNNTVGPELWSKSLTEGKGGSINDLNKTEDATFLEQYTKIPNEINGNTVNLKNCLYTNSFSNIAQANKKMFNNKIFVVGCKNSDNLAAPKFKLFECPNLKATSGSLSSSCQPVD